MNPGAFIFKNSVLTQDDVQAAADLADALRETKRSVHAEGKYVGVKWFEADLDPALPFSRKILQELGVDQPEVFGFYYLEPGARIHPHRDLTGASLNNRIRFHVPIVTNPGVDFRVSGERMRMEPGDLWYLDTSYKHSVANEGEHSRVHIVVECAITDQIRPGIPRTLKARLHHVGFVSILGAKFFEALVKNSVRDPAYFKAQMGMVARFIGWRFLRIGKPR